MDERAWRAHAPRACGRLLVRAADGIAERRERELFAGALKSLDLSPEVGVAWFPALLRGSDLEGGLFRVDARPDAKGRPLPVAAVDAWIADLVGLAELDGAGTLVLPACPAGFQIDGASWELAAAVARISAILDRAPRGPALASGRLVPGGLGPVDGVEEKLRVCALEASRVALVLGDVDLDVAMAAWFGAGWRAELATQLQVSPAALVERAREQYRAREYPAASRWAAKALLAGAVGRDRGLALWVSGACRLHRADPLAADELAEARGLLNTLPAGDLDRWTVEEFDAYDAIRLLDQGRPREASARLAVTRAVLSAEPDSGRDRRWREVFLQVAGSHHRVLLLAGDLDGARVAISTALAACTPDQRARQLGDLAEVMRRAGDLEGARRTLADARRALPDVVKDRDRSQTARFLALYEARAGGRPLTVPVAPADLRQWPQPAEVLERLLADADPTRLDEWGAAWLAAGPSLPARFVLAGGAARRDPLPTWARALGRSIAEEPGVEAEVRALGAALAEGNASGWAVRTPY